MARSSKIGTVIRYEYVRTATKRGFWLATLFVPVLIIAVLIISGASSSSARDAGQSPTNSHLSFGYTDASGLVSPELASALGGTPVDSKDAGIAAVKDGSREAFFAFPSDPTTQAIGVWGTDIGIFQNNRYAAVAQSLLQQSVSEQIGSPQLSRILSGGVSTETVTFRDGKPTGGFGAAIPGLLFLVLFYVVVIMLGNQVLASTIEEKENRVTEMILTTIRPGAFIGGKIIALTLLGLTQMIVFVLPILAGYLWFGQSIGLPDLGGLDIQLGQTVTGALILVTGLAMLISLLACLGAAMPSVKDAGPLFSAVIIALFMPAYVFTLVVSQPSAPVVQFFLYFPVSAPITALMLNAFGSLLWWQATIVVVELAVVAALLFRFAIELFKLGSLEYSRKLSFASIRSALMPTRH